MANLITDRIKYFLSQFPPFDNLTEEILIEISENITVRYFQEGEFIFKQGEEQGEYWYVVRQGLVSLFADRLGENSHVDKCEEGDIFGIRSLISGNEYRLSAQCEVESLIYQIDKSIFHKLFESHIQFSNYFARGYAMGQAVVRNREEGGQVEIPGLNELSQINSNRNVLTATAEQTIAEAALKMQERNVGSIVVINNDNYPIGIITDTDLRNKVIAAKISSDLPCSNIMSSPVKTIGPGPTSMEVLIEMIKSGAHHLVITEDGTPNSRVAGIVSDHDIMLSQGNHPAALVKQIKNETDISKLSVIRDRVEDLLREYLRFDVSVDLIASLVSQINDEIIRKAVKNGLAKLEQTYPGLSDVPFAFLSLGSEGREEQLLRTDQDNALVYANGFDEFEKGFLALAEHVNQVLIDCGFEECPADIMARNSKWNQPVTKWKSYFTDWISSPDPQAVMHATIFFDYRRVYGDQSLVDELNSHISESIQENEIFLNFLAQNALQNPPPVGFFKGFLLEKDGRHKDQFDIKGRAMMPISDMARLLALSKGIFNNPSTIHRWKEIQKSEPNHQELISEVIESYKVLLKHRADFGLKNKDSGRFINPKDLNKLERQMLKKVFDPITELQEVIKVRYRLAFFN
ncbi:MAG: DUF294 nucleotidyltransferase-like domain-containing protein [bacterium]|nr:DUF294 nucleotidyltransferase-like domain-containing protein [bacterium]